MMVTSWPAAWRETLLESTGIPITRFALDVLSAWQQSTPTSPWTNNPLGLRPGSSRIPLALGTPYGAFPSMRDFGIAFIGLLHTKNGREVFDQLAIGDSLSGAWRTIHALGLPANHTEQDYPHILLDMVEASYRDKVTSRDMGTSRGTGAVNEISSPAAPMRYTAAQLTRTAISLHHATRAMNATVRGMSNNG